MLRRLDEAVHARSGDWAVTLEGGAAYAWSAAVRVTEKPNVRGQPDRSVVLFQAGGGEADDPLGPALTAALAEVESWAAE